MNRAGIFCTDARTESPMRLSFPSCEELGIPLHSDDLDSVLFPGRTARNFSFHLPQEKTSKTDPFSPYSMIPLPSPFVIDPSMEPTFIRKRNERERERVRCVNDGYTRLKEHIPLDNKDKRISKVEILRAAISYIKHLQALLEDENCNAADKDENTESSASESKRKVTVSALDEESETSARESSSTFDEPSRKRPRV